MKEILLIIGLFIFYYLIRGRYMCPCPNNNTKNNCYRFELWGLQINHLVFYIVIGYFFPNKFYIWQLIGLLWEILEFIPIYYPKIVLPIIGGCVQPDRKNNYINILDRWLPHSKEHFWHPKLSDLILNIIGFYIGKYIM